MSRVLLLSGGMDSSALAYWIRPEHLLFIDYGQRPAPAEERAARGVASDLALPLSVLAVDCSAIGATKVPGVAIERVPPAPGWWPYRNQLIVTVGAGWAILHGAAEVIVAGVATDADQYRDGSPWFWNALDALLAGQEGALRVRVPAIGLSTEALIGESRITLPALAATYSCHTGPRPCGECAGCAKRESVLAHLLDDRSGRRARPSDRAVTTQGRSRPAPGSADEPSG